MNKLVIGVGLAIAGVIGGTWYLLRPPNEAAIREAANAVVNTPSTTTRASTSSVAVLPLENLQKQSAVKLSPQRTVVPLKSALAQQFEAARQLKPFYDRYIANPETADAETKFFAALALERCIGRGKGSAGPSPDAVNRFQNRLKENDPTNEKRIEAFNRITESCEGFANTTINPSDIQRIYAEAAAAGNPAAKVVVAEAQYQAETRSARGIEERRLSEGQLANLRDALASGDPFALERARFLLSNQLQERRVGPNNDPYSPRDWGPAWQLAACDRGANCGSDSYRILNGCAYQGACGYDSLETYMQFNELPPNVYQAAQQNRQTILDAIAQGRWDWLGIAPGMGRTVPITPPAPAKGGTPIKRPGG